MARCSRAADRHDLSGAYDFAESGMRVGAQVEEAISPHQPKMSKAMLRERAIAATIPRSNIQKTCSPRCRRFQSASLFPAQIPSIHFRRNR
jgi:hypothetical protein